MKIVSCDSGLSVSTDHESNMKTNRKIIEQWHLIEYKVSSVWNPKCDLVLVEGAVASEQAQRKTV